MQCSETILAETVLMLTLSLDIRMALNFGTSKLN